MSLAYLQLEWLLYIDGALKRGVAKSDLIAALTSTLETGVDATDVLLFTDPAEAAAYWAAVKEAQLALVNSYPELSEQSSSCGGRAAYPVPERVEALFSLFDDRGMPDSTYQALHALSVAPAPMAPCGSLFGFFQAMSCIS